MSALCGLMFIASAPALATTFTIGEFVTYDQNICSADPSDGPPASILATGFFTVYPASVNFTATFGLLAPGGFTMIFEDASFVADYLPQLGAPAALDHSAIDPHRTSAGVYGGQVVALASTSGSATQD